MKRILALILALMFVLTGCATVPEQSGTPASTSIADTTVSTTINLDTSESTSSLGTTKPKETTSTTTSTSATTSTTATTGTTATTPVTPPEEPQKSSFSIQFINVGQADAALIECDNRYMLIDGGNVADSDVIYTILNRKNITKLDIVVATHAHEDHCGGLPGAFQVATADLTLCPVTSYDSKAFENFKRYANEKGNGIVVPEVGDVYQLGTAKITIIGVNGGSDTNDTSIVLRIDYKNTSFIFAGDAERAAEQVILDSGADLSATVLKVGHHGSETSTTYPFLREILPQYAVISVGTGNSYGHPTEGALSRLRDAGCKVFRTDLQGDIFCHSDGETVTFSVTKNPDADVFGGIGNNSTTKPEETTPGETTPEETTPVEPTEKMVWIPKSGTKYHSSSSCSNMKNPTQVTKSEAIAKGYGPCSKCH